MELLLEAVLFLAREAAASVGGAPATRPNPRLLNAAGSIFTRFDERDLERYFRANPDRGDTSEEDAFVFLPLVPNHRLLPVLSLAYDFGQGTARLQVVVFIEHQITTEGPRAFGYRFDPPEGRAGRHHYWHAQPILEVRLRDGSSRQLPGMKDDWRPAETPAFPLDASEALDLLICMMISLYGLHEAADMQARGLSNRLGPRFGALRGRGP